MDWFTGPQRAFCVKHFYWNIGSPTVVGRLFRVEYGLHDLNQCPSTVLIKKWVDKFEETGSTLNLKQAGAARTSRSEDNVMRVSESVRQNPDLSTRKRSAELGISRSSLRRILKIDLKLHPYKIQLVQELKPNDFNLRKLYAQTMLERFSNLTTSCFLTNPTSTWTDTLINRTADIGAAKILKLSINGPFIHLSWLYGQQFHRKESLVPIFLKIVTAVRSRSTQPNMWTCYGCFWFLSYMNSLVIIRERGSSKIRPLMSSCRSLKRCSRKSWFLGEAISRGHPGALICRQQISFYGDI